MKKYLSRFVNLPLILALSFLLFGGLFLLNRADGQARDTIRKHHLADLEQALFFARRQHGTYPPYDQAQWCGTLDTSNQPYVRSQIETALRTQHDKYANPLKPFPTDPQPEYHYFYWKRSPAVFELYAHLEQAPTGDRSTTDCPTEPDGVYDYSLTSVWRESI